MFELARQLLFAVIALPALVRALLRLNLLARRNDLEELAQRMASVRPWRLRLLSEPHNLSACVYRLASHLPPGEFGPCLKRSLLLLDLWSRCGLEPRIHLGGATAGAGRHGFHAWVSVSDDDEASRPPGYAEIWSYPRI